MKKTGIIGSGTVANVLETGFIIHNQILGKDISIQRLLITVNLVDKDMIH